MCPEVPVNAAGPGAPYTQGTVQPTQADKKSPRVYVLAMSEEQLRRVGGLGVVGWITLSLVNQPLLGGIALVIGIGAFFAARRVPLSHGPGPRTVYGSAPVTLSSGEVVSAPAVVLHSTPFTAPNPLASVAGFGALLMTQPGVYERIVEIPDTRGSSASMGFVHCRVEAYDRGLVIVTGTGKRKATWPAVWEEIRFVGLVEDMTYPFVKQLRMDANGRIQNTFASGLRIHGGIEGVVDIPFISPPVVLPSRPKTLHESDPRPEVLAEALRQHEVAGQWWRLLESKGRQITIR